MSSGNTLNFPKLTNGQLWVGNGSTIPSASSISGGVGIGVTNGSGSIQLYSNNSRNVIVVSSSTHQMVVGEMYVPTFSSGDVTFTLPATGNVGDTVGIVNNNASGGGQWHIVYGTGQFIRVRSSTTTVTTGSLSSAIGLPFRSFMFLVCTTANTEWVSLNSKGVLAIV